MKKIVVGICGVLVFLGGLAGLRSGALKADELAKDTSLIVETGTVDGGVAVPESSVPPVAESVAPAPAVDAPPVVPQPEAPVTGSSDQPPVVSSQEAAEVPSSESSTVVQSSDSSVGEDTSTTPSSTTDSSSAVSSESSTSSVPPISSSGGTQGSTTIASSTSSSTASSSTTPSSTPPSTTKPSAAAPSSDVPSPTVPSASDSGSSTAPVTPPSNEAPSTPAAPAPVAPSRASVQSTPFAAPTAPEAFDATSTLKLPEDMKAAEVAQSDLKGYELPLLSSFEDKNQAAMIYEGIRKVGVKQEDHYEVKDLADALYQDLFDQSITKKTEKLPEEIPVGSLLYQKKKNKETLMGIALGDDYYLTVDDVELEDKDAEDKDKKEKERQVIVESLDVEEDVLVQALPKAILTAHGKEVLADYPASMNFTENDSAKAFIEKVGEDAQKLGQDYDVFASVMIAQALIESGSGTSTLSLSPNHNLFGIKGTYSGQSVSMATQEDRGNGELYSIRSAFRKYPNYAASLGDYVQLLRGGISGNDNYYQQAWRSNAKNYLRTTQALTGTYATDTTYGKKLNSIIALYHLTKYDGPKIDGDSGLFIKEKKDIPSEYRSKLKYPAFNGVNYNASGSYPTGQCTWYAFNRVKQLGKSVDDYMGNGGQWAAKGKALGYQVSQKPKVGWLISFKPGVAGSDPRYGHVAFVEAVRPEGILISEGNVYGGTTISYRVIDTALATSDQVTYVKAK